MSMRRNADDRIRELERRVIQGDLGAVLMLHQERKRVGQEREYFHGTSYLADAPGLGEILVEPQNERTILVKFGTTDEGVGSGASYSRRKVNLPPVVIRGVPYRGMGHFGWYEGEGFVPFGPAVPGRTYREDWLRNLDRTDRVFPRSTTASPAAKAALLRLLTPFVNQWAAAHKREMLESEVQRASNHVQNADKAVEKAIGELEEAQQKLADALVREIQAQDALKGLP